MPGRQRTAHQPKARPGEEIWETTTPGTTWVAVSDGRGGEKSLSVGGGVGQRLRIKSVDREVAQDRIQSDEADPFVNGLLRRVDDDQQKDERTQSEQVLSTEDLMAVFEKNGAPFQAAVKGLNELNVRRLAEMAEAVDASASQINFLKTWITENFTTQGAVPSYQESRVGPEGNPTMIS